MTREITGTERVDLASIRFCLYGTGTLSGIDGAVLLDLAQYDQGEIWARVENSGSEGYYVEVARFLANQAENVFEWRRYAFAKFMGGEIAEMRARECAERVAGIITAWHGEPDSIIHALRDYQTWTREKKDAALAS